MYTIDIHSSGEKRYDVKPLIDEAIKTAKREKDKLLCLIVGYGSSNRTHVIKTEASLYLAELKLNNRIKGYIFGNELDIFNEKYQKLAFKDKIPEVEKQKKNPGMVFVGV